MKAHRAVSLSALRAWFSGPLSHEPLLRNAFSLVANAVGTAGFGLIYWVLAARLYSPRVVGASSAMIAGLLLLSTIAQLNLGNALTRFLARGGSARRRFIFATYSASIAVAVAAAFVVRSWLTGMGQPLGLKGTSVHLWLTVALGVWCIFALQDHVLTGLRRATWVPIENAVFGSLKIVLLIALAASAPQSGILTSWIIPMALMLFPINFLIFRRLVPRSQPTDLPATRDDGLGRRQMGGFIALDYLGSLFNLASTHFLPVLVAGVIGVEANGYFYTAWVVASTLDLAMTGVASSLTVEGAHEEKRLPVLASALAPRLFAVWAAGLAVICLAAPLFLSFFGSSYAANSSGLLRLLAIGLLPRGLIIFWMSILRVRNQLYPIVLIQGASSALILALSVLLMPGSGIVGVGIAYAAGQTAVAILIMPQILRFLSSGRRSQSPKPLQGRRIDRSPSMKDLTVVVPVKNAERFVQDCLFSLVQCQPAEIIVVDGLSTDSTLELVRRFPVRILSDEGRGLPAARAIGVEAANTRWVALVDVDIIVMPGDVEALLSEFVEDDYVGLQARLCDVSGKGYWGRALVNHHRIGWSRKWFGLGITIFERSTLLSIGFDETFLSGEDFELRLRLKDLKARTGISRHTVVAHQYEDTLAAAEHQWSSDGKGLGRVICKRGWRAGWLVALPLASTVWGVLTSLIRLQPQWIPYFLAFAVSAYSGMFKQIIHQKASGSASASRAHEPEAVTRVVGAP